MNTLGVSDKPWGARKHFLRFRKLIRGNAADINLKLKKEHKKQYIFLFILLLYFFSVSTWKYNVKHPIQKRQAYIPRTISDAFLLCDPKHPCCHNSFHDSLFSLQNQTLPFNSITIFHSCNHSIQPFSDNSDVNERTVAVQHQVQCEYTDIYKCILSKIIKMKEKNKLLVDFRSVLIIKSSNILYPFAHENVQLYTELRPDLVAVKLLGQHQRNTSTELKFSEQLSVQNGAINFLPLLINIKEFEMMNFSFEEQFSSLRHSDLNSRLNFLNILKFSRLVRQPLYLETESSLDEKYSILSDEPDLWRLAQKEKLDKAYLSSDEHFFRWSSRKAREERFRDYSKKIYNEQAIDVKKMHRTMDLKQMQKGKKKSIMFFVPFLQIGGSEKCVLNLANHAISMDWDVSIILTMPFWDLDDLGEVYAKNEWINRAKDITPNVFDLTQIAPFDYFAKLLRYFLESRKPDYIFVANTAAIYEHLEFINLVSPGSLVVDYNHMLHWGWEPKYGFGVGGLPRYGTYFTKFIHTHFTASNDVSSNMQKWIDSAPGGTDQRKVKTCYIGTELTPDSDLENRKAIRQEGRSRFGIGSEKIVIMFIGRFVLDKGVDIISKALKLIASDSNSSRKITFLFVGSGPLEKDLLQATKQIEDSPLQVIIQSPTNDAAELQRFYSVADILLLPSRNEGIALVIYEAMASGLLVMSTDVGGQSEILNSETGELLPKMDSLDNPHNWLAEKTMNVTNIFGSFDSIRENARNLVTKNFTLDKFCDCIFSNMETKRNILELKHYNDSVPERLLTSASKELVSIASWQKRDSQWSLDNINRPIESLVTIGIKTYVCDTSISKQILNLLRSIRFIYPYVRILVANDGPLHISGTNMIQNDENIEEIILKHDAGISYGRNLMVGLTKTEYFVLLDDDHVFDYQTDLKKAVSGAKKGNFDIVGFRVFNLPGIYELEAQSIFIPRYVALVSEFRNRRVRLCVWNENNGPGVSGMKIPIKVDVLHNALIAKTSVLQEYPWRNELKVNEHLTFFLDARKAGLNVGYLPSVYIHHQSRQYSSCYKNVRFREDKYETLLDYEDKLLWDTSCGDDFPDRVRRHLNSTRKL